MFEFFKDGYLVQLSHSLMDISGTHLKDLLWLEVIAYKPDFMTVYFLTICFLGLIIGLKGPKYLVNVGIMVVTFLVITSCSSTGAHCDRSDQYGIDNCKPSDLDFLLNHIRRE